MNTTEAKAIGATHYMLNPTKEFIELYYKIDTQLMNDGLLAERIQYISSFNIWMGSTDDNIKSKLIPID